MTTQSIELNSPKWFSKLLLSSFFLSLAFIIIFANNAINFWPTPWNQISIVSACLFPLFLVIACKARAWSQGKEPFRELKFIPILLLLGVLNIAYGELFTSNLKGMGLFLLSGVCVFTSALFLLKSKGAKIKLFWVFTFLLIIIALHSIYVRVWLENYQPFFSNNPIPESSIITLLLAGPLMLLGSEKNATKKTFFIFCILLGVLAIISLKQRAPIISLIVVCIIFGFIYIKRFWVYLICATLLIGLGLKIGFEQKIKVSQSTQNLFTELKQAPIYRMEMYFFAFHMVKKKPLLGTGLWAPLNHHLYDYEEKIFTGSQPRKNKFHNFVESVGIKNTSFHNIIVCMFVQMGGAFALTYLWFLSTIFIKAFRNSKFLNEKHLNFKVFSILLFGFFIQSMSFDSLMYPDINFLFHSLLGVMASFNEENEVV